MANNLTRFDPFGDIAPFNAFRGFDDFFKDLSLKSALGNLESGQIKVDVSENDKDYVVKAEIPGVKKEDVKVTIDGSRVSIRAETKRESEEKAGETVVRRERYYGVQSRSFMLEHDIEDSNAMAKYQDGVLELTLPKKRGNGGAKLLKIT